MVFMVACSSCKGRGTVETWDFNEVSRSTTNGMTDVHGYIAIKTAPCQDCLGAGEHQARDRVPVVQDGVHIGSVPPDFDADAIESLSFLYAPRRGDFRKRNGSWIADPRLGSGDLKAINGFRPE